jgi:hypothetical protein
VAIIRAGVDPSVLLPLTNDAADRLSAVQDFELDDGPADLAAALRLADRVALAAGDYGQILVVTDRDPEVDTNTPQVLLPVGMPADTVAITSFAARRVPDAGGEYAVRCEVAAFTSRESRARLTIVDGDVPLLDRPISLQPNQRLVVEADGFSNERAQLRATLTEIDITGHRDALASDDDAFAVVEPLEPLRVLLVSAGNTFLEGALALHPGLSVDAAEPSVLASGSAALAGFDALVLDGLALPATVSHPAVLTFAAPSSEEPLRRPRITASMASHPALGGARLSATRIDSATPLPDRGAQVLLRAGRHALATARDDGAARSVSYGFALTDSDVVQTEAFPLMLHHGIAWVAREGSAVPLPSRLGTAVVATGDDVLLAPTGEAVPSGELPRVAWAGFYQLGERPVAVSATEHAKLLPTGGSGGTFAVTRSLPPLATVLAIVLALLMLLEWTLIHRGRLE